MEEIFVYDGKEFKINLKSVITKEIAIKILDARKNGIGTKPISCLLQISPSTIRKFLKNNGVEKCRVNYLKPAKTERNCKICKITKPNSEFRCRGKREGYFGLAYECYCICCEKEYGKSQCKKRYANNREKYLEMRRKYVELNKDKCNEAVKAAHKKKAKEDPSYRLKVKLSNIMYRKLKLDNLNIGFAYISKLDYSIDELKEHLERQFEPWMNWNNWGKYILSEWDDNDQSTWKWQIDHIIPQSKLKFSSMDDDNFKKCWSLNNLRPLSAKANLAKFNK